MCKFLICSLTGQYKKVEVSKLCLIGKGDISVKRVLAKE
jgi:hypothetical protein